MLPRTIDGMKHVCYFRHALALDERRVKFLPEYAYGGSAKPPPKPKDKKGSTTKQHLSEKDRHFSTSDEEAEAAEDDSTGDIPAIENANVGNSSQVREMAAETPPHTLEVWFPGTHSDM
jgi:hypothetical protein